MSARNRFKYVSHKLLRWFGGLFLAAGAGFAVIAIALASPVVALGLVATGCLLSVKADVRDARSEGGNRLTAGGRNWRTNVGGCL